MDDTTVTRATRFVDWALGRMEKDNGFAAELRRADNPDTEGYALGILCTFGVDVEQDHERLPFALVGAALSRWPHAHDGSLGLGAALRQCFEDVAQGEMRLRRLLACDSVKELFSIVRPLVRLIQSRDVGLAHARLLDDMLAFRFENRRQRIKLRWAREYYGQADLTAEGNGETGPAEDRLQTRQEA